MKTVRIGCGQGFWGDSPEAPVHLLRQGPLDYLVLDYLAEVTMSILARHKQKNPQAGYARDFVDLIGRIAADADSRGVKIVANAGGVNPQACAEAVKSVLAAQGLDRKFKIGIVSGDDISSRLDDLVHGGEQLVNMDDGRQFKEIRSRLRSANVYLGAEPIAQALAQGANIVITGRVADPSLVLGPAVHEFRWAPDNWDRLAAAIIAGHIIECGAQASGGNCSYDWEKIPDLAHIGYPLVELSEDGTFVVTKQPQTGGCVTLQTVKEQLIYEIGDPKNYITPDVTADFTSITLKDLGGDRVKVSGARGRARPAQLKASMSYQNGYTAAGTLVYSWPDAYRKAKAAGEILRQRIAALKLPPLDIHTEVIGINACHGPLTDRDIPEIPEVVFRIAVRGQDEAAVERFTREVVPLVLNGPPSATAYFSAKGAVHEVIACWPALVNRNAVKAEVKVI